MAQNMRLFSINRSNMRYILFILLMLPLTGFSQDITGWHHLDPYTDSIVGISTEKAFDYLKGRTPDTVIVAIIDNGADIYHNELKNLLWINEDETAGNNRDDDGNGYVDDVHGWNFLGNEEGDNIKHETLELTRLYAEYNSLYSNVDTASLSLQQREEFELFRQIQEDYKQEIAEKTQQLALYGQVYDQFIYSDSVLRKFFRKGTYEGKKLEKIKSKKQDVADARDFMIKFSMLDVDTGDISDQIDNLVTELETRLNPGYNVRTDIIKDDPADLNDTIYGNNMVYAMGPSHGTGVSGILGGARDGNGVEGIAPAVKFMILRVVPNGDERDKDVALAIRYAVKNGADIINCSFGKKYSPNPEFVSMAVEEAEKNDVLIVHAAGNDNDNVDVVTHYPSGLRNDGTPASNWITVGASTQFDNERLAASFSNYGRRSVDIFAPGYRINTANLNNEYSSGSGTSYSAPVVAGVAAVLKSYFPDLTAPEIKEIILKSAYIPETQGIYIPGTATQVEMEELCASGGVVNLYNAVKMADEWSK